MERITGSGKSCVRPKQKLSSGGDFPWSCKVPARLYPSEHSILRRVEADLLNAQALILTLFRLMEPGGISLKSALMQLMENLSEVRPWGIFGPRSEKQR